MSNNLTRKGLAATTGLALAVTTLLGVAPAANAAAGDVRIAPDSGSTWAVFNSDTFEFDTLYRNGLEPNDSAGASANAWELTNADGEAFEVIFDQGFSYAVSTDANGATNTTTEDTAADSDYYVTVKAFDSRGVRVENFDHQLWEGGLARNDDQTYYPLVIDFDDLGATRVVIHSPTMGTSNNANSIELTPVVYVEDANADIDLGADGYDFVTYSDGDFSVGLRAWRELSASANYNTVDSEYAGTSETVNFYDPATVIPSVRIERFAEDAEDEDWYLLSSDEDVSFTVGFNKAVNLDQIDKTKWEYFTFENNGVNHVETDLFDNDYITPIPDYELDDFSRLHIVGDYVMDGPGDSYRVAVSHTATGARLLSSGGFTLPGRATDTDDVEITVSDAVNAAQEDSEDTSILLRAGTKSVTYKAQLMDGGEAEAQAGVTVLAIVNTESFFTSGASMTVSSAQGSIDYLYGAVVASGVTDAKGQWSFTVTTTSGVNTEEYQINTYWYDVDGITNSGTDYNVDYVTAAPSILEADNTLISGANVTLNFTVTDQFGQAVSVSGTKPLNIELTANDPDVLSKTAAVTNGKASFTFANYLAVGQTDLLTANVYTGTAANPTYLEIFELISLYNTPAAASVSVATSDSAAVTYADFITGTASATNVAPAAADAEVYTGSVLDANGAGIAGAVVTVAATGFQFRAYNPAAIGGAAGTGAYFKDTINVVTDTNGQFNVLYWVQKTSSTGVALTATSGGKSATTTVKSYLPTTLSAANLNFSWTLPAVVVKNTTYAVTAKLTDKWGNPVSTVGSATAGVSFQGSGSVEVNSSSLAVARNFSKDGTVTVFLRSVKDIAGPGEIIATLGQATFGTTWNGAATGTGSFSADELAAVATNNTATVWDETKFSSQLSASVEVLDVAPAGTGKVNVGSFNGKLVVYASGLNGAKISWKVGGVWGSAVATSNYAVFNRPTPRAGVTVSVDIYVNGVKTLTKSVLTR